MRLQFFTVFLLICAGCDRDSPSLIKRYVLDSEVSLASKYSPPVGFHSVFPAANNNSIVFLTTATTQVAVLIDGKGAFIKQLELPEIFPLSEMTQDKDGDVVAWRQKSQDKSDFYFITSDLAISSKLNVTTVEDPLRFGVTKAFGKSFYRWTSDTNQKPFLTAYDLNGNQKWTTDVSGISTLLPMFLFHPNGDILVIRFDSEQMAWGKLSSGGEVLWTRQTPWDDIFSEGHRWSNSHWLANGDLIISSMDQNQPVGSVEMATFDGEGALSNVTSVAIEEYKSFSGQFDLRVQELIETNDGGFLISAATSAPPHFSLVKLDSRMNPGWIGKINLVGDTMVDMLKRGDESIVYLTSQGSVMIFRPEF